MSVPSPDTAPGKSRTSLFAALSGLANNPAFRSALIQLLVFAVVVAGLIWLVSTTADNLKRAGISSGFGFLDQTAGFEISQTLIEYSRASTYARVFWVGLLNTMLVSVISIVASTLIGFLVGVLRLSSNWLVSRLAAAYIGLVRNIPLLLQILFWYIAILMPLPGPRLAYSLWDVFFLCNRGLILPRPEFHPGAWLILTFTVLAVFSVIALAIWARRRQRLTGRIFPTFLSSLGLLIVLPLLGTALAGFPVTWEIPELRGFNFQGGVTLLPELTALVLALTLYTAGFIAENVRAGIQSVDRGQEEAAAALGLRPGPIMRLVIIPQAMRVIIPPLTSQHLTLVKNSSLAVVIGYPDLISVFAGTTLNQTGQAVEIIAMTMLFYLTVSLLISLFMNWYNNRMAQKER
ncbi:amino acid ABC transporter membrane protein 1, PAAT family (TC 3.A.1.3.-) [Desulfonatronum thiosulfatophilum]|uniref:Amino acid ABC transporter membrane protein 1, PAAT family (TC 3.A.1.3.-) n=1 Tax=Desulfonatronum thiosulfatophilum TaxID=617002 RepID=A0A1G6BZ92_9BACT|nr:amino acid ABC transporter permease [Desulfonatronum thiosulfatophilum]SDB25953.1 amino acid ABC transporter membrane protein 1, PAAT family (TC 3.A.1.3.-) [Desulfonatronum thiosulfatophilum]